MLSKSTLEHVFVTIQSIYKVWNISCTYKKQRDRYRTT